jgi:hypothetical protein
VTFSSRISLICLRVRAASLATSCTVKMEEPISMRDLRQNKALGTFRFYITKVGLWNSVNRVVQGTKWPRLSKIDMAKSTMNGGSVEPLQISWVSYYHLDLSDLLPG